MLCRLLGVLPARITDSSSTNAVGKFIRAHNETLPVVAMCVCNSDRSPVGINRLALADKDAFSILPAGVVGIALAQLVREAICFVGFAGLPI